jgi:hypothetical protein
MPGWHGAGGRIPLSSLCAAWLVQWAERCGHLMRGCTKPAMPVVLHPVQSELIAVAAGCEDCEGRYLRLGGGPQVRAALALGKQRVPEPDGARWRRPCPGSCGLAQDQP